MENAHMGFLILLFIFNIMFIPGWAIRAGTIYWATWLAFAEMITLGAFKPWGSVISATIGVHYSKTNAVQVLALFYVFTLVIEALKVPRRRQLIVSAVLWLTVGDLLYMAITGKPRGIMSVYTFNTGFAFIAWWLWMFSDPPKMWKIIATVPMFALIVYHGGGGSFSACAAFGICYAVFLQVKAKGGIKAFVIFGVVSAAYLTYKALPVLQSNSLDSRLTLWREYFKPWHADAAAPWVGFGPGSFEWTGMFSTIYGQRHLLMHNDYLQIAFEYGAPLGILFVYFIGAIVWRLRRQPVSFAAALMYAAFMVVYYPMHFAPSLLIGAVLLAEAVTVPQSYFETPDGRYVL